MGHNVLRIRKDRGEGLTLPPPCRTKGNNMTTSNDQIITAPKNLVIEKADRHPIEDTQFFTLRDADTGEDYGHIGWSPEAGFHCFRK